MSTPLATQENNITTSTPVFQDWSPIPSHAEFTYYQNDNNVVDPQFVNLKVKDVIGVPAYSQYNTFRIITDKVYVGNNPVDWFLPNSPDFAFPSLSQITSQGLVSQITLGTANLNLLLPGIYNAKLVFVISGRKNSSQVYQTISTYVFTVKLTVYSGQSITFQPPSINFLHVQTTPVPSKPILINGPIWTLQARDKFILSSNDPAVEITTENLGEQVIYKASGSGSKVVNLSLSDFFNLPIAVGSSYLNSYVSVRSISTQIGNIPVSVQLESPGPFYVNPTELNFSAVTGTSEPTPQNVFVFCEEEYSFVHSPWLVIELIPDGLKVVPIPTQNMESGTYSGFITLNSIINGVPSSITIPVIYELSAYADVPYSPSDFNFTLDEKFIFFSTTYVASHFEIQLILLVYSFFENIETELRIPLTIPVFNGEQKYNIGLGIHRLMKRMKDLGLANINQYKPSVLTIEIQEIFTETNEIIRTTNSESYKFIAGIQPEIQNNSALLVLNNLPMRVTPKGFAFLNILQTPGIANIEIFKNGFLFNSYFIPVDDSIILDKIVFAEFNQGDIIDYRLVTAEGEYLSKKFLVFPEGIESNMIIWEDKFLLKSAFEFTGKFQIKSDYDSKTYNSSDLLREVTKVLDVSKTCTLIINTGHISKHDSSVIDDLLLSRIAWLYVSENNFIELIPKNKNLLPNDSDRELISYDIEFQINRKYNEEVYTF